MPGLDWFAAGILVIALGIASALIGPQVPIGFGIGMCLAAAGRIARHLFGP